MDEILIVDDDPNSLSILARLVEKHGFAVRTAGSGQDCLDSVTERRPDLILLDVVLPDILGTEICTRIKSEPSWSEIIIILLSGHKVENADRIVGIEVGADDYMTRPVHGETLLAKMRALLRMRETFARDSSRPATAGLMPSTTDATGAALGVQSIREAYPTEFEDSVRQYSQMLVNAVKTRELDATPSDGPRARALGQRLGFLKATARDVVDVHRETMSRMLTTEESSRTSFYIREEGRILLVHLLGILMDFYRIRC